MKAAPLPADAILRYVAERGPVDTAAIAAHFGAKQKHTFHRINELAKAGLIERAGPRSFARGGRTPTVWCMPGCAPLQLDDEADDELVTAPMVQRYVEAGAWQRAAPGPAARWFDGLVS